MSLFIRLVVSSLFSEPLEVAKLLTWENLNRAIPPCGVVYAILVASRGQVVVLSIVYIKMNKW